MQTERQREAAEFRALGSQRAQEFHARADREVTVLLADANSRSEQIRGEGDAERNRIFAAAFERDQDFFAFYRTIQAYEKSFRTEMPSQWYRTRQRARCRCWQANAVCG